MPSATYEWCKRMAATGATDAVLQRLIRKHDALVKHNNPRGLIRALERIKTTGVPWFPFHLAFYPELKAGKEYILDAYQRALPVPDPERMNMGPENFHPSLLGDGVLCESRDRGAASERARA